MAPLYLPPDTLNFYYESRKLEKKKNYFLLDTNSSKVRKMRSVCFTEGSKSGRISICSGVPGETPYSIQTT